MSSQQQQPRQWFRFGSFFQGAHQLQTQPPPPTTPTQPSAIRTSPPQPAPKLTPPQEPPRPAVVPIEVPVLRYPVTPAPVSTPAPRLPTPTPTPQPLAFQPTTRAGTLPGFVGASNEATIMRSVAAPMPPSAPTQRLRSPPTLTPVSRSPPQAPAPDSPPPPLPSTTVTSVPSLNLQPSEKTNALFPYSSPMSRTPPSMQTSPRNEASSGIVFIRSSSMPITPVTKLSEPTSLLTSPAPEPPSPSRSPSPPPSKSFPSKSSNQDRTPKAAPEYVKPMSESIQFRKTNHLPSYGNDQAQQKNVLMQETLERSRVTPNKGDVHDQSFPGTTKMKNGVKEKGNSIPKKHSDLGNFGTRLILEGVNRGAIMDLGNGEQRESSSFRGNGRKLGSVIDGKKEDTSNPNNKKGMSIRSTSTREFINSNVQGINNSIVYNSACRENDPGVHLFFSRKGNVGKEQIQQKDHSK